MSEPASPKELRLAVAMRGGVSLAVWMGGACSEIAALRLASLEPNPPPGTGSLRRQILSLLDVDQVTIDVLVGTSAGGLNGSLMAAHLAHGVPFDSRIRDLWLRLGDLEQLLRLPKEPRPPSLLKGDEKFYEPLRKELAELLAMTQESTTSPVNLILTATRVFPGRKQFLRTQDGNSLPAGQRRSHFTFRLDPTVQPDKEVLQSTEQLAFAARATSSFPGAFEPATVRVNPKGRPANLPNMTGISSETGFPDDSSTAAAEPFTAKVMDGGVMDNVPLAWAFRTIASMPATGPVDRWLLYLQPAPEDTKAAKPSASVRAAEVLKAVVSAKTGEPLAEDIEELQRIRSATALRSAPIPYGSAAPDQSVVETYEDLVGNSECRRLELLISDPVAVLGPDTEPFPARSSTFTTYLNKAESLDSCLKSIEAIQLSRYGDQIHSSPTNPNQFRSPFAAARAVERCAELIREIEAAVGTDCKFERTEMFRLRGEVELKIAKRDRLLLEKLADQVEQKGQANATVALRLADINLKILASTDCGNTPLPHSASDRPGKWQKRIWRDIRSLRELIDHKMFGLTSPTENEAAPGLNTSKSVKAALLRVLPHFNHPITTTTTSTCTCTSTTTTACANCSTRALLVNEELVSGPLRPDPLALIGGIPKIAVVTSTNVTRLSVPSRVGPGDHVAPEDWIVILVEKGPDKLAGNQIANFASFLSVRWRLNDWIWGRLDGAASLAQVLATRNQKVMLADLGPLFLGSIDTGSDPKVPAPEPQWSDLLRMRWTKISAETPTEPDGTISKEVVEDIIRERLQWQVLVEELPYVKGVPPRQDVPVPLPGPAQLFTVPNNNFTKTASQPATSASEPFKDLFDQTAKLSRIGKEMVPDLLRKTDLRRTLLRAALVAWRLPDKGPVATGLLAIFKPVYLTFVFVFLSPVTTLIGAIVVWMILSYALKLYWHPLHILPAVTMLASIPLVRLEIKAKVRKHKDYSERLTGWQISTLVAAVVAGIAAVIYLLLDPPALSNWCSAIILILGAGFSSALALWRLPGRGPIRSHLGWRKKEEDKMEPGYMMRLLYVVVVSLLSTIPVALTLLILTLNGAGFYPIPWPAAAIGLMSTSAVVTICLTYSFVPAIKSTS